MSDVESIIAELSKSPGDKLSDAELDRESRQEIAKLIAKQNIKFRPVMFYLVIGLMILEVVFLIAIVTIQGFGGVWKFEFKLDEWVLAAINGGILLQTFGLAQIITKALFPKTD